MGKAAGITLIELTVVLFILGLIGSSLSMSSNWITRVKLEQKAKEIVSAIEYAKQASLTTGINYSLTIKNNKVRIYKSGATKTLVYTINLEQGQSLINETNGKTEILLNSNGAIDKAITLTLRHKDCNQIIKMTVGVATSKVRQYRR